MIKKFQIFENSIYIPLKRVLDSSGDINEEELEKVIGFESKDYDLDVINDYDFTLSVKENFFEDFVGIEKGVINYYFQIDSNYSNYEYHVDDSEMEYISSYFDDNNQKLVEKICDLLYIEKTDDNLRLLIPALGDNISNDILYELSYANEAVVEQEVSKAFKDLPFQLSISYTGKFDLDVDLNIHDIIEYIEKNELKEIETISDFLYNVDYDTFSYEIDYVGQSDFEPDYTDLNKVAETQLEDVIEDLEQYDKLVKNDPNQMRLFDKEIEEMDAQYKFKSDIFSKLKIEELEYAKQVGGKLLAWFESYEFQKNYMDSDKVDKLFKLKKLKDDDILNPKIDDEYGHLESAEMFNI